jgi:voltage-gated potassium channel
VPATFGGQLVAALVMLLGIGFLTVITASITSTFVARSQRALGPSEAEGISTDQFQALDRRLERIEAALSSSPPPP